MNYINARDVALMHVAAILDPEVQNERIFAWGGAFSWNELLAIFRKLHPEHKFIEDFPAEGRLMWSVDDSLGRRLMKKWGGQEGWTSLEQTIKETLEGGEEWGLLEGSGAATKLYYGSEI